MSKIITLSKENFDQEVLQSKLPVLVDFWAQWCQPCIMMAPALEELSEELSDQLKIGKLDIEAGENRALAIQYQIQSIPNMKLFKNGQVVKEFIGLRPKAFLKAELQPELQNS